MNDKILFYYDSESTHFHHTVTPNPDPDLFPFRVHSHTKHEIYYFVSGEADFTVENNTYCLKKGMLILSASGQTHHLIVKNPDIPYERIVLMFAPDAVSDDLELFINTTDGKNRIFLLDEKEQAWFEESCAVIENCNRGEKQLSKALLSLADIILTKLTVKSEIPRPTETNNNATVNQILLFIHRNLNADLSLTVIEKALFRNKAHLNRIFKNAMGIGIWEYVVQKRILNARQQLYLTKNISKAFESSGFKDYSVFYRNYVKHVGTTPSLDLKSFNEQP